MNINERLKTIITKLYSGNKRYFATSVDIAPSVVENIVGTRQGKPSYDVLEKICANAHISPEWLLTGAGEMLKSEAKPEKTKPDASDGTPTPQKQAINKVPEGSDAGIPLIPLGAMAGFGSGEMQILDYDCERYIVPMFKDAEFLIQVKGSSMQPKYNSGDLVACKKLPLNDLFFLWNKVYVIDTVQGALVKRINQAEDNDHILLCSENPSYPSVNIHKSQIYAVSLVVGVIRQE
ncbi:MAG: hypothetical protein LBV41_11065 [Cytophagaceae bacterium]|jgi:phage repressor protein C with HTH and peptisase S24 domain|nr:hypothetical protein [Cytophagaceae bacterium]